MWSLSYIKKKKNLLKIRMTFLLISQFWNNVLALIHGYVEITITDSNSYYSGRLDGILFTIGIMSGKNNITKRYIPHFFFSYRHNTQHTTTGLWVAHW